jgi:hypothetical protein
VTARTSGLEQRLGREHVVAHRGVDLVGGVRQAERGRGLLEELFDPGARRVGGDDAELVGEAARLAHRGDRRAQAGLDVLRHHLPWVHPVDVVGAEDDDVLGLLVVDQVEVLEDGVGRPGEPVRATALLGGHRGHVVAEHRGHPPGPGDVPVEAVILVLGQHDDLEIAAVDEVREDEVDEAVDPPERDGRLRPVPGERHQPLALAAGENDRENPRGSHACEVSPLRLCRPH